MRTKTLLFAAAAMAVGLASSTAQVYSLNVVGYVNKEYSAGWHMVANPLNATNNSIASLMPAPPLFTTIFKFSGGAFSAANTYVGAWGDPAMTFNPGDGGFLNIPAGPTLTNTYVGEVLQGSLTNSLIAGFNMVGSKVPQQGALEGVLGLVPALFDTVFQWDSVAQNYGAGANTYLGAWGLGDPVIGVGEAFWYNSSAPNDWIRNFTVPTP